MDKPLVSVNMITYNHEKYIAQAIEGVLLQKTNFKIELIIGEDGSPDGTAKIVKEYAEKYPDIIVPVVREKNIGMIENVIDIYKRCQGKYVAVCEGDDYWIDPLKLQKQVDFLEENEDYGLVHTNYQVFQQKKNRFVERNSGNIPSGNIFKQLLTDEMKIATLTVLGKTNLFLDVIIQHNNLLRNSKMADSVFWLYISSVVKVKHLNIKTAVYRILENSASHSREFNKKKLFIESSLNIRRYFAINNAVEDIILHKLNVRFYSAILHHALLTNEMIIAQDAYISLKLLGSLKCNQRRAFYYKKFPLLKNIIKLLRLFGERE